jgi:hypothetical protein
VVLQLPHLALEIMFGGCDILLIGVVSFLIVAVIIGCNNDMPVALLLPLLATLGTLPLVPLTVALDGAARLALAVALVLPRTKVAPIASSPEVCRVAISSSSLVVFSCSWSSL